MSGASAIYGRIGSSHVAPHFESPRNVTARHAARVESAPVGSSTPPPPAAAAPLLFTVDGSGLLARRTASASGEQRGRRAARPLRVNSGLSTSKGGEGTESEGAERRTGRSAATLSMPSFGLLPSAVAAPFTMRGVSCGTPLSSSGNAARVSGSDVVRPGSAGGSVKPLSRRTASPAAATAQTQPRVNNYLASSAATPGLRTASANRAAKPRRPPRAPTATSLSTSPSLTRASSCETSASSLHHGERETGESGVRGGATRRAGRGAVQGTVSFSSADRVSSASGAAPPLPVRPVLRPPPPPHAAVAAAAQEDAYHAAEAGSTSSANTTTARSDASGSSRTASRAPKRPHVPLVQMTRTFALRRPVLLTKDTSAAAAAAGGRKPTRADAPEASSESPLSPVVLQATTASAAHPSSAGICSPTYAPMPPRTSGQARRLRRTSLASLASNSSAALHSQRHSLDDEAAATRSFFAGMPSFTDVDAGAGEWSAAGGAPHPFDATAGATAAAAARTTAAPVRAPPASALPTRHDRSVDRGGGHLRNAMYGSSSSINSLRYEKGAEKHHQHRRPSSQGGRRSSASDLGNSYAASAAAAAVAAAAATTSAGGVIERLRERGNQYMLREEFAQAIATYSEAIRLAPRYDVLWGNRAAAFLLTFRYLPAVADCLYVLNLKPGSVKAYWRAAKAYAAANRFLDAKKYYLLAQQACLKEESRVSPTSAAAAALDGGCDASGSSVFGKSSSIAGDAAEKAARDRRAIEAEEQAVAKVEAYWQHMRSERWAEAVAVVDAILGMASYTGPTAVSWQALRLEALLYLHPKATFAEAEALHRRYPEALELYYVLAKSLFHTVHDASSTRRCVQLLDEAAERRSAQNTLLNVHVRYAAMQLREGQCSEGGDTAAAQLEAWGRRSQLREDSRIAELRYSIEKFARHRDAGNAAYERGNWEAAVAAYTQCLQTDRLNHALLAAVYCNRTAVYMQAGRWREALSDADAAIQHSPQLATAYGRRGRIQLYLLSQEYEAQRMVLARHYATQWSAAAREQLTRYADAAAADLTRAVELAPTAEHKMQLQQALAQRQTVKAALSAQPTRDRQGSTSGPSSSSSTRGVPRPGGASGEGSAHQRTFPNSHPASSASSTAASLYASLQQHLHLLGLHASSAAPNVLPDVKVIAKAYRECALRWHPDKWVSSTLQEQQEAERQFKLISLAYTALRERCADAAKVS